MTRPCVKKSQGQIVPETKSPRQQLVTVSGVFSEMEREEVTPPALTMEFLRPRRSIRETLAAVHLSQFFQHHQIYSL